MWSEFDEFKKGLLRIPEVEEDRRPLFFPGFGSAKRSLLEFLVFSN